MIWLFTQVWLWSLAAFVLGAFMSWLLFTRPARRGLKQALAREQESYIGGYYQEPVYHDQYYPESGDDRTTFLEESGDLRVLDGDRTELVRDEEPEQIQPVPGFDPTTAQSWVAAEVVEPETTVTQPPEESRDNVWFRGWGAEDDFGQPITAAQETTSQQAAPNADAQSDATEENADLSGQLRSLFDPVEPGKPADAAGHRPPDDDGATTVLPKIPRDEPAPEPAATQVRGELNLAEPANQPEGGELPKRIPAGKPADTAQTEQFRIPDALRQRVEAAKPHSADTGIEPGTAVKANIKPTETLGQNGQLPKRTPGAHSQTGRENGPMIKGHSASRQYHSPDSPQYDNIVADVWFRTPNDAETAGFMPWHGGSR